MSQVGSVFCLGFYGFCKLAVNYVIVFIAARDVLPNWSKSRISHAVNGICCHGLSDVAAVSFSS